MSDRGATGWRFDWGANGTAGGPALTLAGGIATVSGNAAVRQAIMLLLSTRPGERVMRPDYGCPLHRLVFDANDETAAGLAVHYVRRALLRFEPRVEVIRLHAVPGSGPAGDRLEIVLDYRVRATGAADRIVLALPAMAA